MTASACPKFCTEQFDLSSLCVMDTGWNRMSFTNFVDLEIQTPNRPMLIFDSPDLHFDAGFIDGELHLDFVGANKRGRGAFRRFFKVWKEEYALPLVVDNVCEAFQVKLNDMGFVNIDTYDLRWAAE